jgi:rod shape-determining protein MreD
VTSAVEMLDHLFTHPFRFLLSALPVALTLLLVMLANMPVSFTGGVLPAPVLALAAVYFWVLVRPDLMPPFAVLMIGLMEDLLSGGPPGLWAAGFLAAYALTDRQRETFAGLAGAGALLGFAGAMLLAGATAYVLATMIYLRFAPVAPLLLESVSTVVFYPVVAFSMGWVHKKVVGQMRGGE